MQTFKVPAATRQRAARWGMWAMIALSLLAIAWRIAEPDSLFSEAACLAMLSYLGLYLAVVPKRFWNLKA